MGTNRRHVLPTFNGMSHEIMYTGPLKNELTFAFKHEIFVFGWMVCNKIDKLPNTQVNF